MVRRFRKSVASHWWWPRSHIFSSTFMPSAFLVEESSVCGVFITRSNLSLQSVRCLLRLECNLVGGHSASLGIAEPHHQIHYVGSSAGSNTLLAVMIHDLLVKLLQAAYCGSSRCTQALTFSFHSSRSTQE